MMIQPIADVHTIFIQSQGSKLHVFRQHKNHVSCFYPWLGKNESSALNCKSVSPWVNPNPNKIGANRRVYPNPNKSSANRCQPVLTGAKRHSRTSFHRSIESSCRGNSNHESTVECLTARACQHTGVSVRT